MKRLLLPIALLLLSLPVAAQVTNATAGRVRSGAATPATCSPGQVFMVTGGSGATYQCLAANTWTYMGSVAGASSAASFTVTGTGGNGYMQYLPQASPPSAPASGFREYADSLGRKAWIRASDGFTRTWDATLTANRVYTLPDASVVLAGSAAALTSTQVAFATTGGLLTGDAKFFYDNTNNILTLTGATAGSNSPLRVNQNNSGGPWSVEGAIAIRQLNNTANDFAGVEGRDASNVIAAGYGFQFTDHTNHYGKIVFSTRGSGGFGTYRAVITEDGLFAVNRQSPTTAQMEIVSGATGRPALLVQAASGESAATAVASFKDGTGTQVAYVRTDGGLVSSALTSGRVPFATTGGLLLDDANFTYAAASGLKTVTSGSNNNARFEHGSATTPAFIAVNSSGSLLFSSNVDAANNVIDVAKPQWRYFISQSSDSFGLQRSPAGATWTPTMLFTVDGSGRMLLNTATTTAQLNIVSGATSRPALLAQAASGESATNLVARFNDGSGTQLAGLQNNGLPVYAQTVTAGGTTGAQTINKAAGTVNVAAAGTSVTVTNSLVSTSSTIHVTARTNDSTCYVKNVVPSSGSFVINLTAGCTAETSFGFLVVN